MMYYDFAMCVNYVRSYQTNTKLYDTENVSFMRDQRQSGCVLLLISTTRRQTKHFIYSKLLTPWYVLS